MEFKNETEFALFIKKLGGDLWLVGGFVRDTLLNKDPLRIYRAARFASKFEFIIHDDTKKLIYSIKDTLLNLPGERVNLELQKVLSLDKPSRFFSELFDIGVLDLHFQEISNINVPDKHDGTALNHTLTVMDYGETPLERFCLLVHDLGKGLTPKESHPSHYKHDSLGIEPIESLCERIKIPNLYKNSGILCAKFHMKMKNLPVMRKGKALRFILDLGDDFDLVKNVSYIDSAYREGSDLEKESFLFKEITKLAVKAFNVEREVNGKLLVEEGYTPNKKFGEILFQRRVSKFREVKLC